MIHIQKLKASKNMVVKVYGPIKAACPQRVLACLLEFRVDYELINVDLDSNEHKLPKFLQKQVIMYSSLKRINS